MLRGLARCERKTGQILTTMEKRMGGDNGRNQYTSWEPKTLADLRLTKHQSAKWQQLAAV